MPACSGKTLLEKLGIRTGHRDRLPNVPTVWPGLLKAFSSRPPIELDVILLFVKSIAQFQNVFALRMRSLRPDGTIRVVWPRKASGSKIGLSDIVIHDRLLQPPFADMKVCAINDTWSGLKRMVRNELRDGWTTSTIYGSVPVQ